MTIVFLAILSHSFIVAMLNVNIPKKMGVIMANELYKVVVEAPDERDHDNPHYTIKIEEPSCGSCIVGDLIDFDAPMIKVLDDISDYYAGILLDIDELWNLLDRIDRNVPLILEQFYKNYSVQVEITVDYLTSQLV